MAVDVEVTSVQLNGNQATAECAITPKGVPAGRMPMSYNLEQRDGKWSVLGLAETAPHGGAAIPGGMPGGMPGGAPNMENPHGGGMPMPGGPSPSGGRMPSPDNLPPAGNKK
jgi:hypothetical protein